MASGEDMSLARRLRVAWGRLTVRIAIAFAVVSLLTAGLAAAILSIVWAAQFDAYIREGLESTATGAAQILSRSHQQWGGWTLDAFAQMPRFGIMSGLGLQVLDLNGDVIYDDAVMGGLAQGKGVPIPSSVSVPSGPIATAPVESDGEVVGLVQVWQLSAVGVLAEGDQRFRRSSSLGLAAAALVGVAFASLAGLIFATGLARPIERISATASALSSGNRGARTGLSGDDSIALLGRTLDEMADSIEADRELERRLTADVAHELRTPLQAIQATVEAMQDGVLPNDAERLEIVRNETVRLGRLADGILELTRLERGTVPMRFESVALDVPVRAAVDAHRVLIESCGLVLSEALIPDLVVNGDTDRLTQAVGNLLSNAARYTPDGGHLKVSLRAEEGCAVLRVCDTGIGIAQEDAERVFSRFWRADSARESSTGGLGIGLAVVREIVERHEGSVVLERFGEQGSTFTLRIPLL